jgi:hypothetical protein
MHRRTLSISIALASAAAFASAVLNCGGPQINMEQLAQAPGLHKTTPFSITVAGQTVSYKAGSTDANYDPSTRELSLYVSGDAFADGDDLSFQTCDVASYNKGPSGNFLIVRFKDFDPTKTGTFSAIDADIVSFVGGYPTTKKGALSGVTLNVTQTDNNRIVGTLSGGNASGDVDAWPCFVDGGPGGLPTPAPTASDSASAAPATSTAPSAAVTDAGASPDDASKPAPTKKKKKKKS